MTELEVSGNIGMVTKYVWILVCAAALWTAVFPQLASAQISEPRRITATYVTSKCIGDVSDPICAAETWIACRALAKPEFCTALGVDNVRFDKSGSDAEKDYEEQYHIVEVLPIIREQLVSPLMEKISPGLDHVEIRTMARFGNPKKISEDSFQPYVYYLKKVEQGWHLAAWTNDVSVTCYYAEAETPPCKLYFYDQDTPWVHELSTYEKYQ